jgi:hypothetical protein
VQENYGKSVEGRFIDIERLTEISVSIILNKVKQYLLNMGFKNESYFNVSSFYVNNNSNSA